MIKKMFLILISLLSLSLLIYAEDNSVMVDDCVDLSAAAKYSEGIYASVIDEESRGAYDNDFTMLMRRELKQEWVEYEIETGQQPVFYTYFRQNEEIAHFSFEQSADGNIWSKTGPKIRITEVDNYKWIPVKYTLNKLKADTKFVRIYFSDKNTVEWSPMLARVGVEYEADSDGAFADCIGLKCENAVNKLKQLGFIDGYNRYEFKPQNNVTRAEFAKVISKVLNTGISNERVFPDVNSAHFAYSYLAPLYSQGIVSGDENGRFNPEKNITYTEAAKILVASLGYMVYANDEGGYPYGYIKLADRLDIFSDVEVNDKDAFVTRGDMAQLVSNTVEKDLLVQTTFGENPDFEKKGTVLSEYHRINKISGVVSGADGMSIISDNDSDYKTATVNDKRYNMSQYNVSKLLGQMAYLYVDDKDNILYGESAADKIIDITAEQYIYLRDNNIYYENESQGIQRVSVDNNTRIVLNGRYYSRIGVAERLNLNCGDMRIIYNDSGAADTILITDYKTYIAKSDGRLSEVISDRITGTAVKINDDKAENTDVTLYGEKVEFDDAMYAKNDIISVASSADGEIIKIDIASSSQSGILDYYNVDSGVIRMNSDEYKLSEGFKMLKGDLKAGVEAYVYFDLNGRIIAAESLTGTDYAYLIDVLPSGSFNNGANLKVLSRDGGISVFKADDKTYFCGARDKIIEITSMLPQLLKISVKGDRVSKIDTVGVNGFEKTFESDSCKYYGGNMSVFSSKYQLSESTPIFYIPSDNEDSKYRVINKYGLYSDFYYNVSLFDLSEDYVVGAAVIFEDGSRERIVDSYDEVAVIDNVEQITNAGGELCLKISAYIKGEMREIYFDNDGGIDMTGNWIKNHIPRITAGGLNPFKCGEVIQYYSDSESHCRSYRMLLTEDIVRSSAFYEKNTGDYGALNSENYFSELYTIYGSVNERFSDKLLVAADDVTLRTIPLSGANIYVYDKVRKRLNKGTTADIPKGGVIFARMSYADTVDIVVID